jgi:hypothetical protein
MNGIGYSSKYSGKYVCKNPSKYKGNANNIVYRSGLEYNYFTIFDTSDKIKSWQSEEVAIPYINMLDNKIHRYFPDLIVEFTNGNKFLIELKPKSELDKPKKDGKKMLRYIENTCKWNQAEKWAKENDMHFLVLTEQDLNNIR